MDSDCLPPTCEKPFKNLKTDQLDSCSDFMNTHNGELYCNVNIFIRPESDHRLSFLWQKHLVINWIHCSFGNICSWIIPLFQRKHRHALDWFCYGATCHVYMRSLNVSNFTPTTTTFQKLRSLTQKKTYQLPSHKISFQLPLCKAKNPPNP